MSTVRVMLVDDHTLFAAAWRSCCMGATTRSGAPRRRTEAARLMQEMKPDVLLLDLNCRRTAARAVAHPAGLRLEGPTLILTVSDSEDDLATRCTPGRALPAEGHGAGGCHRCHPARGARRDRGRAGMTMKLVDLLQPGRQSKTRENLLGQLTSASARYSITWRRACRTRPSARARHQLHTVKLHVRHILSKLNFTSRSRPPYSRRAKKRPQALPSRANPSRCPERRCAGAASYHASCACSRTTSR